MKNMTLSNLAKACNGVYVGPKKKEETEINAIAIDSRQIGVGDLFVATKGERVDGHSFIKQCMEKGALGVVSEKDLTEDDFPEGVEPCYIKVTDSFQALKAMAAFYRQQLTIPVIGITGSVGKTSTKEMIAGVLSAKYTVLKTAGNFNNEVGLPLTVFRIRPEHEVAVLEMGISDFGEMSRLTAIAKPDICVITNIGQCHLENLGDRDGILRAKTEIFEGLSKDGSAVLNGADDKLITVKEVHGKTPLYFDSEDCYATDVESKGIFGSCCTIHVDGEEIEAEIAVPGVHQVSNAMAAVRVAKLLDMTKEEIEKGITLVKPIDGRNHIIQGKDIVLIDDCYNANPVSMKAALDLLTLEKGRKVAILGDMFELGENENKLHEQVGAYAMQTRCDVLICIGKMSSEYMFAGAMKELGSLSHQEEASDKKNWNVKVVGYETKEDFLMRKEELEKGDTVLLKASHGMHFETMLPILETMFQES